MITPRDLKNKADKLFFKIVNAELKGESFFPLFIPSNKKIEGTNFSELKDALLPLYQQSKQAQGKGYTIDWKEKVIEGSKQKIPSKIYFESLDDYLFYVKRYKDYEAITKSVTSLIDAFPTVKEWAYANSPFLLNYSATMEDLIKVCKFFVKNRPPYNLFLRELPIEIHSKFIEYNFAPLRKLLDVLLPPEWVNATESDFLNRYNIKRPTVFAQIRLLDDSFKAAVGFDEFALTLDDCATLNWQPQKVFIIENRACFLSFPKVKNAVAIFGEGFKSRISKHFPWLLGAELYCWFDIDAAGFEMLNMIREYYPQAKSFLMDAQTYHQFNQYSVTSVYRTRQLARLTDDELSFYQFLQQNNKRLEQERINNQYISDKLLNF